MFDCPDKLEEAAAHTLKGAASGCFMMLCCPVSRRGLGSAIQCYIQFFIALIGLITNMSQDEYIVAETTNTTNTTGFTTTTYTTVTYSEAEEAEETWYFAALFIGLFGFFILWALKMIWRYRLMRAVDIAKEGYGLTRQGREMFVFLFLYTVAYLSGVTVCVTLAMKKTPRKATFYVFVPLWQLYVVAKKDNLEEVKIWQNNKFVKEKISEEDTKYEDKLVKMRKRAKEDLTAHPLT